MTFDSLAEDYDSHFTRTRTGAWLRGQAHARMVSLWQAGDSVLELGCGTGEDARMLAGLGVQVYATDASPMMLETARAKNAGISPAPQFSLLDLNALPLEGWRVPVTGVLANFGVLNCVQDRAELARWLAACVPAGGVLAFAVMSPVCVWEMVWHGAHLDFATATRRLRRRTMFRGLQVRYPSPRRLTAEFAPYFRRTRLNALGVCLPPGEVYAVIEKRPRLWERLRAWEVRVAGYGVAAWLADHYWIEFRRNDTPLAAVK